MVRRLPVVVPPPSGAWGGCRVSGQRTAASDLDAATRGKAECDEKVSGLAVCHSGCAEPPASALLALSAPPSRVPHTRRALRVAQRVAQGAHMCLGPIHVLALLWMARYGHPCRADTPCWITSAHGRISRTAICPPRTHTAHAQRARAPSEARQAGCSAAYLAGASAGAAPRQRRDALYPSLPPCSFEPVGEGAGICGLLQLVNFITMLSRGSESLRFLDIPG